MRSSTSCRRRSRAAFEFRHPSWLDDEVFERLAARNLALCVADSEKMSTPVRVTADYAYFRLRDEGYTPADIGRWADTIARETSACRDVFVYFKHEEEGKGPGVRAAADGALWKSRTPQVVTSTRTRVRALRLRDRVSVHGSSRQCCFANATI